MEHCASLDNEGMQRLNVRFRPSLMNLNSPLLWTMKDPAAEAHANNVDVLRETRHCGSVIEEVEEVKVTGCWYGNL